MFQVTVEKVFSAAHAIRLYDGTIEPVHGHDWPVQVTVAANELDAMEVVMDFHQLETALEGLIKKVNNHNLNDLEPFKSKINPTAERVAWWIGESIAPQLPEHVKVIRVSVGEAPGCTATYRPSSRV